MPYTSVQICNMALSYLGNQETISDLSEASQEAEQCSLWYEPSLHGTLHDFPWPFATKYQALGKLADDPDPEHAYAYNVPTDMVRARRFVTGSTQPDTSRVVFTVGRYASAPAILTNWYGENGDGAPTLEYTSREEDANFFTPAFADALAWRIAYSVAMALSVKESLRESAFQHYQIATGQSKANALNEISPPKEPESAATRARA